MTKAAWRSAMEGLSAQIQKGEFASAEETAKELLERRAALADWPPEDLDELRLYVFNPRRVSRGRPGYGNHEKVRRALYAPHRDPRNPRAKPSGAHLSLERLQKINLPNPKRVQPSA
jgi:hypothetical protein